MQEQIKVATKWSDIDANKPNPVRNSGQDYLKFINTRMFSEEAYRFLRNKQRTGKGFYISPNASQREKDEYWTTQLDRIINGYTVGGVRITGRHYYYLNFVQIKALPIDLNTGRENKSGAKIWTFPRFLDHNYYLFHEIEKILVEGPYRHMGKEERKRLGIRKQGMVIAKSRRKGMSYFVGGGIFGYNFLFQENSKSTLAAFESSHYKVLNSAFKTCLNMANKYTEFGQPLINNQGTYKKSGVLRYNDEGQPYEDGLLSEFRAASFKDNAYKDIGECLSDTQRVIMYDGTIRQMKDVNVGDKLLGVDGTPRTVLDRHDGYDTMTTYSQYRGVDFSVNTEHLMYGRMAADIAGYKKGDIVTMKNKDFLNMGSHFKRSFKTIRSDGFEGSCNDIGVDPYFYGLWLGDGTAVKSAVSTCDKEVASYMSGLAEQYNCGLRVDRLKNNRADLYCLTGKKGKNNLYSFKEGEEIIELLGAEAVSKRYGLSASSWKVILNNPDSVRAKLAFKRYNIEYLGKRRGGGSPLYVWLNDNSLLNNKHVFSDLMFASREVKLGFLAGLIDSDGCLVQDGRGYNISQKSRSFLEDVAQVVRSLGFYASVVSYERTSGFGKTLNDYSVLSISGDIWNIPVKIERKKTTPFHRSNHVLNSGIKKVNEYYGKYVGIKVDKDNLFMLEDFTVIHNSNDIVVFEEAGKFEGLINAYDITEPTFREGGIYTGVSIVMGTGGDMESGTKDFAEMFYKPKGWDLKAYDNIYDENAVGDCGWFIDDLWYKPPAEDDEDIVSVDEQGNSFREEAYKLWHRDWERKKKESSEQSAKNHLTQYPITPAHAFLRTSGTLFDTMKAQEVVSYLMTHPDELDKSYVVDLYFDSESNVRWEHTDKRPIREFPLESNRAEGAVELFELPQKIAGDIPPTRYIAGLDPYDNDYTEDKRGSLGSIFIFDRFKDRIVAEYTGRPDRANKFYETCRRLLLLYNARALYERANKNIYAYFQRMRSLNLLADEPEWLKEKGFSRGRGTGNLAKGFHPNDQINSFGREQYDEWTRDLAYGEEEGQSERTNMDTIRSMGLLKETIAWSDGINADRISAMVGLFIFRESLRSVKTEKEQDVSEMVNDPFIQNMLGTNQYAQHKR